MFKPLHVIWMSLFVSVGVWAKPYVIIVGPNELQQVRVNIEQYEPNGKEVKSSEISFGDGVVILNQKDIFHQYSVAGKYLIRIKTWNHKNQVTIYEEEVDVSNQYLVKDIPNSTVFEQARIKDERKYKLNLSYQQASRLYKLTLNRNSDYQSKKKCKHDYNVEINGIDIFRKNEVSCRTTQIERFIWLRTENKIKMDAEESRRKNGGFSIKISAVEIEKNLDRTSPVIAANQSSNSITRNNLVHISVTDESAVTTRVYDVANQLIDTLTEKEFDLLLNEGVNNFTLRSTDAFGNNSADFLLSNITLDTQAPNINAILLTEYIYNMYPQTVTISIQSDEDLQLLTVNNIAATMISPRSFIYLLTVNEPSTVELSLKAFDLAGNESIKIYNPIFSIENTAPVISSSLPDNTFTNVNTFSISVVDNSETVTEVYKEGVLVLSTVEKNLDLTLIEGANHFLIKSKDIYNNEALDLSLTITYDITAPLVSHNIQSPYFTNTLPFTIPLQFTPNEPLKSLLIDNQVVIPSNGVYSFNKIITAEGSNFVLIRATDKAGNILQTSAGFFVRLDTQAPVQTFGSFPTSTFANSVVIPVTITDLTGVVTNVSVNQVFLQGFNVNSFSVTIPMPNAGTYSVRFQSTDRAGNVTTSFKTITKQVDTNAPIITLNNVPTIIVDSQYLLPVHIEDQTTTQTYLEIDGVQTAPTSLKDFSYLIEFEDNQTRNIKVISTDAAGNQSAQIIQITRDTSPLKAVFVSPQSQSTLNTQMVEVRLKANKPLSSVLINGQQMQISQDQISVKANIQLFSDGEYTFNAVVNDIFGSTTSISVKFEVSSRSIASWTYEECPAE